MTQLHYEILSPEQKQISGFIGSFDKSFVLVWWTAIALWLGHRKSIDFDLFLPDGDALPMRSIQSQIHKAKRSFHEHVKVSYHYEGAMNGVKITRYGYPYSIPKSRTTKTEFIHIPKPLFLAAMKIDAFNGRWKRKDYVDMYFLIKRLGLKEIIDYTKEVFDGRINTKLFASQLSYFDDISYNEQVEYMPGFEVSDDEIKKYLIQASKDCYNISTNPLKE